MTPVDENLYMRVTFSELTYSIEHLHQIKAHLSNFSHIQDAIDAIPHFVKPCDVSNVIRDFNHQLADYKNVVGYRENIFTIEQLRDLEQQSIVYKLIELRGHISAFEPIQIAIYTIPHPIIPRDVLNVVGDFNHWLTDYKNAAGYRENIFTIEQLRDLEQKLIVCKLVELRGCVSAFELIKTAIDDIPHSIELHNAVEVMEGFNDQLADCKNAVGYYENIFTIEQLHNLERQLTRQQLVVNKLIELKQYSSEYELIKEAISRIPEHINVLNASYVITIFNDQIANCKTEAYYHEKIFSKEQVEVLEQRLSDCDESLGQLWHVLPIDNKPRLKRVSTIRKWLKDIKNLSLLDTVTSLDLTECNIVQLPVEISCLRKLKELKLTVRDKLLLPEWITGVAEVSSLDISYNQQVRIPICKVITSK